VRLCRLWLFSGGLFCLSLFSSAAEPRWVEVRSPNFSVITDAGAGRGRAVALHFEQMRAAFGVLMTKGNVNLPVPLQIVAFRNKKELRQVAPMFNGVPTELSGLFQTSQDRSFIMLDMSVDDPWKVVFHEYAHQLMDGNLSFHADPWFREGFAEYFSSIQVDNKEALLGKIPNDTYEILKQLGWMKVSDLLKVAQDSKTYYETGDRRSTFYAESGLLVHYLYDNDLVPKLSIYFDALQVQKKSVDDALQTAIGMNARQLDHELRGYQASHRSSHRLVKNPVAIVTAQFTVTPVSVTDARALMADIHAHSPDYKEHALAEFQEILKDEPNNAWALRGAGFAAMERRNFELATGYLRRAVELSSKDARVHLYYATLLDREDLQDEEDTDRIKQELETAIGLDPTLADAYSLLGFTQAFSGELEKGTSNVQKALELAPQNERYLFNMANAYLVARRTDEAIAIFQNLAQSGDSKVAAQSSRALAQAISLKGKSPSFERIREGEAGELRQEPVGNSSAKDEQLPSRFVKGKLVSVDCSKAPHLVISVIAGKQSLRLHIQDVEYLVLIGSEKFSCDWKNKNIAVNYRERDDGNGDVVSLEMQ